MLLCVGNILIINLTENPYTFASWMTEWIYECPLLINELFVPHCIPLWSTPFYCSRLTLRNYVTNPSLKIDQWIFERAVRAYFTPFSYFLFVLKTNATRWKIPTPLIIWLQLTKLATNTQTRKNKINSAKNASGERTRDLSLFSSSSSLLIVAMGKWGRLAHTIPTRYGVVTIVPSKILQQRVNIWITIKCGSTEK